MVITAHKLSFYRSGQEVLFKDIHFTLQKGDKAALVGNNGVGKTTLLKILAGQELHFTGDLQVQGKLYVVPQHYGHFDGCTVAQALGIASLLEAWQAVENGATDQCYYDLLEHNWDIAARCQEAFAHWGIAGVTFQQRMEELSGGMKTRLFLAGIDILQPAIVLLDEPTNHLDSRARQQLYAWMEDTTATLLIISHDRALLRRCQPVYELRPDGLVVYGGNYDLYETQKGLETAAKQQQLAHQEKTWKEARLKQQEALERKQHADAQARKKSREGGLPKILLNGRKHTAQVSSGKLKQVHQDKVEALRHQLEEAAALAQVQRIMKGFFEQPVLPPGKVLIQATDINYRYGNSAPLWSLPLTFTIRSGSRWRVTGNNGSGKTTLFQLLQGVRQPSEGRVERASCSTLLLDQDYSIIQRDVTVLQQALQYNHALLEEAMVHTLLANFLFYPDSWDKKCGVLSGGEMLRLSLCCMVLQHKAPDLIYLDEPVNNLDLANIRMLASLFAGYRGTLVVISHDRGFLEDVQATSELAL